MRDRPNIILITLHDLGRHLKCYDPDLPATPAIQRIADEGAVFERHFSTCPLCSPARASIITGRYPHSNGMNGLTHRGFGLNPDEKCLPQYFTELGYHTALYGLQHETQGDPRTLGYLEVWDDDKGCPNVAPRVAEFLLRGHDRPFLLAVGFAEVHREFKRDYVLPPDPSSVKVPPYLVDCAEMREDLADFYGLVQAADWGVKTIIEALDASGLAQDTLLLFTTDHGAAFPRAKSTLYDPGIGVTLLARWPGKISAGSRIKGLTSHADILPTLLEIVGAQVPERIQGRSFARLMLAGSVSGQCEIYAEKSWHGNEYDPMRCVRTERYKYVRNFNEGFLYQLPLDILRSPSGKVMDPLRRRSRPMEELYDLEADPNEMVNLAGRPEYASVQRELSNKLKAWMEETGDPLPERHIPWPCPDKPCFMNNMG